MSPSLAERQKAQSEMFTFSLQLLLPKQCYTNNVLLLLDQNQKRCFSGGEKIALKTLKLNLVILGVTSLNVLASVVI